MKSMRVCQTRRFSKDLVLVKDNRQQLGVAIRRFNEGKAVVSLLFNGNLGRVTGFGRHMVEGHVQRVIGVGDSKPSLEGTSHTLQHTIEASTTGLNLGKTIKDGEFEIGVSRVGKGGTTDQGSKVFFGKNKVFDSGGKSVQAIDFLDFDLVGSDIQDTLWLVGIILRVSKVSGSGSAEGFDFKGGASDGVLAGTAHKGTESNEGSDLVGLVGGVEFQEWVVLGFDSKGGDTLTAVDVECPNGLSKVSGNTGKKRGKGGLGIVILHDKSLCVKKDESC